MSSGQLFSPHPRVQYAIILNNVTGQEHTRPLARDVLVFVIICISTYDYKGGTSYSRGARITSKASGARD